MISKTGLGLLVSVLLATSEQAFGREIWFERDNKPVFLHPRRFGQEQNPVLEKLRAACPGEVCGTLAGAAVTPLLAAQPECSQQDLADQIIDASKQFDAATQANMIAIAQEYRQAEKNTPPDFTTNPPTLRNSVFCQKAPKNPELNGLVQAQDPANDPNLFFDPATKATVRLGEQANTFPFGQAQSPAPASSSSAAEATSTAAEATDTALPVETSAQCVTAITVTVTGTNPAATNTNAATVTAGTPAAPTASALPAGVDFGRCTVPEIEFAVGFDNRRETSFRPKDLVNFNHGSAQNINIITQFICDQLTNLCQANQAAKDLCQQARAAAGEATPAKTGIQADVFNAAFGINTQFVDVTAFDDQGRAIPGTGAGSAASSSVAAPTEAASSPSASPTTGTNNGVTGVGDFGTCTVPSIKFAAGLDGRRETAFTPDSASFLRGSAQNIGIITNSICNVVNTSCNADDAAKATCQRAIQAANAAPAGTGAQADAFNAAFGIQTNFASVAVIDNQGRVVSSGGQQAAPSTASASAPVPTQNNQVVPPSNASGNIQTFNGALGGVTAPVVTDLGGGRFQVEGNAAFNNKRNALVRSCDVQNNQCANAANASGNQNGFNVGACNAQQQQCIALANASA